MRNVAQTAGFKRDVKRIQRSANKNTLLDLDATIALLANDVKLPERLHDHPLKGEWVPAWECHIRPDLLLIYRKQGNDLLLVRLGSHSELLGR